MISVLLAEDQEITKRVLSKLLKSDPDIDVVGVAATFQETVALAAKLTPQVIVMDLQLGHEDRVSRSQLTTSFSDACVVAMSTPNDPESEVLADQLDAVALVNKTKIADELIPAVKWAFLQ